MNRLTELHKDFIDKNYLTMSNKKIVEYFSEDKITIGQVQYYIKQKNLRREIFKQNKRNIFSKDDVEYIKDNYNNMTYHEIAIHLGFKEKQIRSKAEHLGLKKNRKSHINSDYFDTINSSIKAYFLGFIFADGWIIYNEHNANYELSMELQSGDKYILDRLNNELGGVNIIKHKEPHINYINGQVAHRGHTDVLRVYSKDIVKGLMKNGIEPNKTLKDICPHVDNEFFFDWLRGYIDGDGCFWKFKNHYYMHITCASEKVLQYVQNRLNDFNIKTNLYKENDKKYRLMCTDINEMKKLISRLYYKDDLFYLTRKYEKVKYYLGFAA